MFYSGISDEAGKDIHTQIRAHKKLGWKHLELRTVGGENITALPDAEFDAVCDAVGAAGMQVSCFGSAIANWARPISTGVEVDLDDLRRAIPRMHRLKTPFIRIMSYPNDTATPWPEPAWRAEAIRRVKEFSRMAEDAGVTLVHENCSGWGGLSAENSNVLLGEVNSPALKVVFDTGNPVTYRQDTWTYYMSVRQDIVYVHIKDAKRIGTEDVYTYCGEGDGYVREVIHDLWISGYDGGLSIEPHLAAIIHTGQQADSGEQLYESYTEYGRRLMRIVEETRPKARPIAAG